MTKSILHIGAPKTGTTSMQAAFANSAKVHAIGRFGPSGDGYADDLARELIWSGIYYPSNFWEQKKERYKAYVDQHRDFAQSQGKNLVISHEGFSHPYLVKVDQTEVMRRLQYLFGEDAIPLVLIRDQLAWMKSFYSTFIIDYASSLSFNDFFEKTLDALNLISFLNDLDYLALHRTLTGLFKEVKMMPFEWVFNKNGAKDKTEHQWLADELGLTEQVLTDNLHNQGRSKQHLLYARAYNEHFKVGLCHSLENQPPNHHSVRARDLLLKVQNMKVGECSPSDLQKWSSNDLQTAEELVIFLKHRQLHHSDPKVLQSICDTVSINPKEPEEYPTETHKQILGTIFGPGNQELSKKLGYNLEEMGYVMPPSQDGPSKG